MSKKTISFGKEYAIEAMVLQLRKAHNIPEDWTYEVSDYGSVMIEFTAPEKNWNR